MLLTGCLLRNYSLLDNLVLKREVEFSLLNGTEASHASSESESSDFQTRIPGQHAANQLGLNTKRLPLDTANPSAGPDFFRHEQRV